MAYDQTSGTFDFGYLPPNFNGDVQIFLTNNQAQNVYRWEKPRGVTMCYMVCIGSGAGGGGGTTGATTTARGGGGGGACSGIAKMIIPALFLPDSLIVQIGAGGKGGGPGVNGGAGVNSFISYGVGTQQIGQVPNIILASNNAVPGGGGGGTSSAAGPAGGVPTISSTAISGASISHGIPNYLVGLVGFIGGAQTGAVGANATAVWNVLCLSGGAGGAGVNSVNTGFGGGNVTLQGVLDYAEGNIGPASAFIPGGVQGASGTGASGNGNAGIQLWKPFYMTGGSGGGSSDANTGGNGGNGGIGCGGGGGGAGTTGGTGGNGGDGFVAIISW